MKLKSLLLCSVCISIANTEVITSIDIQGNRRVDSSTILTQISIKKGEDIDNNSINELVKSLHNTELFDDIKVQKKPNGKLTIKVKEKPIVKNIRFVGNKKLKTDDIKKMLSNVLIKPNETLSTKKIKNVQMALLEIYRRMGIYNASVDVKIIKRHNNQVDLEYQIHESKPTTISRIIFKGNSKIPTSDLRSAIFSKEKKWFRFFAQDDKYDENRIEMDKKSIVHYYKKNGFAQAEVTNTNIEINKEKTGFIITFTIHEGEVFKFGNITLNSKVKKINTNNLIYKKRCKKGNAFNIDLLAIEQSNIIKAINKQGFVAVDIEPSFKYNKENKTIDIVLNIVETEKKYISKVIIRGNDKTRDSVIRKELPFEEGDIYSQALLDNAESNLRSTGFFEGVELKSHADPISPDKCIVETNVVEARTGMVQFSASYSTSEGPMIQFGYGEQNFLGTGKSVQLSLNSGRSLIGKGYSVNENGNINKLKREHRFEPLKSANLSISDSHLFGRDLNGGISLFKYSSTPFDNFLLKTYGASVDLSYALGDHLTQSWDFGVSRRTVDHVEETCSPLIKSQLVSYNEEKKSFNLNEQRKGILTSLQTSFNYLQPIYDGIFKGSSRLKWSTSILYDNGFNSLVWKNIFSVSYSKMISRKVGLTLQSSYGMLTPIGNSEINIIDSFTSNTDSIRGFEEGSCCPHFVTTRRKVKNNNTQNNDLDKPSMFVDAAGAKKFINGTVSISFPIGLPTELNFRTFVFMDCGYYWDPVVPKKYKEYLTELEGYEEVQYDDKKLQISKASCEADDKVQVSEKGNNNKYKLTGHKVFNDHGFGISLGIGCSFDTPFGPITLSWGFPIKKSTFDKRRIFNFGMKTVF
ncbi:MAG: outer membrane protein assembly factor BamA [Alphaproteobacteria bacterium]|nr:outer membrane protein assembly factor BamA [Alphaproteobacteria bacterium]